MVSCTIVYNENPNAVFLSGQKVSGSVRLHNEKPRNIRAVLLLVEGYCQTSWSEGNGKSESTYSAREDYMNTKTILIGNGVGES